MVKVNFPGIVNRSINLEPNRTESNVGTIESINRISVLLTTPFGLTVRRSRLRGTPIPKFIRVTVKVLIQNGFLYVSRWPRRSNGAGGRGVGGGGGGGTLLNG